jgi:isopentenyl diphosphate isomerase/L-lactate dehydrogenase-like FMN-dependent dehydrogenase
VILTSAEARLKAKCRLPKILYEYLDAGGSNERTMMRNSQDFQRINFRQRVLVGNTSRSLSADFMGKSHRAPVVLAPIGFAGAFRRDGEVLAARAACKAGLPYCLSMFSICSVESLRAAIDGELWCQLYVTKDRSLFEGLLSRAHTCGIDTICITVDTPAGGFRPRDIRSGMRGATRISARMFASMAAKPRWCFHMMRGGVPRLGNLDGVLQAGRNAFVQASFLGQQIDGSFNWQQLRELRDRWKGKLIVKGILSPGDAAEAVQCGVHGIVVSNHGGRQVDDFPSTISSLHEISAVVDGRIDIMMDSGVRSGVDILKAVALGAKAVWIGRPYAYALAAEGEAGVSSLLASLSAEMESCLAHIGVADIRDLNEGHVRMESWTAGGK